MPPKKTAAKKAAKKVATKQAKPAKRSTYEVIHEVLMAEKKFKVGDNIIVKGSWSKGQLGFTGETSRYCNHSDEDEAFILKIEPTGVTIGQKHRGARTSFVPIFGIEKIGPQFDLGNGDYTARILENGDVQVGCTLVPIKTLDAIVAASVKARTEGI